MENKENRYYLEDWVRGEGDLLREAVNDLDNYHPHITFVRPFSIPNGNEDHVKELIIEYCKGKKPINFTLKGKGSFPQSVNFIPVISQELLEFNNGLEKLLEREVDFDIKLNDEKNLHLTITNKDFNGLQETILPMLRLTAIKNKKIWFSWDFEMDMELNREETLDKGNWKITKAMYNDKMNNGKPESFEENMLRVLKEYDPDEPEDLLGAGLSFSIYGRDAVYGISTDKLDFIEEIGPTLFQLYNSCLRKFVDNPENKTDVRRFNAICADSMLVASEIAFVLKDRKIMEQFHELYNYVLSKESFEGGWRGYTEFLVLKSAYMYSRSSVKDFWFPTTD